MPAGSNSRLLSRAAQLLAILGFAAVGLGRAQTAETIAQVRKIYVEPFSGSRGANDIRKELLNRLKQNSAFSVVASADQSDAVLKGAGEIWVKGHIGTNPRATATSPIYTGYLSITLEGRNAQPLWSYLVTPANSLFGSIDTNLANHATRLIIDAVAQGKGSGGAKPGAFPAAEIAGKNASQVDMTGAGATFPAPLYQAWLQSFIQLHPEIRITYEPVGSERGVQLLLHRQVDFAASDLPTLPPGADYQHYATVLGAVVPIYNLRGVTRELHFTGEVLAAIYLGKITQWNDPAIRALNRGLSLPNAPIAVVHRSDGSGTTYAFTDFLTKTSPSWKSSLGAGSTLQWPVGTGAAGNDGVATLVQNTPNALGYVELTYAIQHELSFGAVRNAAGAFLSASLESVAEAAQTAPDSASSITNAPGKGAYPISTFTWIILPSAPEKHASLVQMLQWMLTSGQRQCSALGYAPLPRDLAARELQVLSQQK